MEILSQAGLDGDHGRQPAESDLIRLREQVAQLQAEREALWWDAGHDELTGLANRRLFHQLAPVFFRRYPQRTALVLLDLNRFKMINDTLGHAAGDEVLRATAHRISASTTDCLVARLGGDEFAAILTYPRFHPRHGWWRRAVNTLAAAIAQPIPVPGRTVSVTAAIGIAPVDTDHPLETLMHRADIAMYQAKAAGRPHVTWAPEMPDQTGRVREWHRVADLDPADRTGAGEPSEASTVLELDVTPVPDQQPDRDREPEADQQSEVDQRIDPGLVFAPTCDPRRREHSEIAPADTYQSGDQVWVYRAGTWRPGTVESASARAVMARYRCGEGVGTAVDTMLADFVVRRAGSDMTGVDPTRTGAEAAA